MARKKAGMRACPASRSSLTMRATNTCAQITASYVSPESNSRRLRRPFGSFLRPRLRTSARNFC